METKYFSNEDKERSLLREAIDTHCGDRSCFDCALLEYKCNSTKLEDIRECYEVLRENNLLPFLVVPAKVMDKPEFVKANPEEEPERIRAQILNEARDIICSDRNKQYGEPEDNFAVIGELWSQYLRRAKGANFDLNGYDVGMLMALFKIGRLETGTPKRDNFVDLAGYVGCAAEIALREARK